MMPSLSELAPPSNPIIADRTMAETATALSPDDIRRLDRVIAQPISLIGMMGVGKSTVGRRLAAMLDRPFYDVDSEIEEAAQMSIAEIFEEFGEPYFRDGERRVIARLTSERHSVIATGGGAFSQADTRADLLSRTVPVWIDCPIDTLVERTARRATRPLLLKGDPKDILTDLYEKRAGDYALAPVHVASRSGSHNETAHRILKGIDAWLNRTKG